MVSISANTLPVTQHIAASHVNFELSVELRMSSTKVGGKLVANVQHPSFLSPLFILHKTIRCETIRNHMHRAGLHDIQIPTLSTSNFYSGESTGSQTTQYIHN